MVASPYAPPISTSPYCAECLEPAELLIPSRPLSRPLKWATPRYCPECYPKHKDPLKRRLKARANALQKRQEDPAQWARNRADYEYFHKKVVGAGAVLSPLVELMRIKPLPPPVRLPQFVWELPRGGSDVCSVIARGMRYMHGTGWLSGSIERQRNSPQGVGSW